MLPEPIAVTLQVAETLEQLGDARAKAAINDLGPQLFPIIHRAEVRLTGARRLPQELISPENRFRDADRYEMVGIIDVITQVELNDPELQNNLLVHAIIQNLPENPPAEFEVIIDYKGMRRPPIEISDDADNYSLWDIYGWQVQTYAHLRSTHLDSLPILAGVIIYLNELLPTKSDLEALRQETHQRTTDIPAPEIINISELLEQWREENISPDLPLEFRLTRTLRIIPVSPESIQNSLTRFDHVVARIESCRGSEIRSGRIINSWERNASDEDTCTRCDSRTFCPAYSTENLPRLPAIRQR